MSSYLRTITKNILKRQGVVKVLGKPWPRAVLKTEKF